MSDLHSLELDAMHWLMQFRTPLSDQLFRFMNYFDRVEFYLMLFPFIWYGFSRTWGIRIFYWLMFSSICNYYFKWSFGMPRPFDIDSALTVLKVNGYGFPSGAAQSTFFLAASLIKTWRSPQIWVLGITYLVLVCFSRVYLGVHFPSDIVGGLAIGLVLFLLFVKFSPAIEKWIAKKPSWQQLLLSFSAVLLAYLPMQTPFVAHQCAAILGVSLGLVLSKSIKPTAPSLKKAIVATSSIVAIAFLEKTYLGNEALSFFLLALWLSFGLTLLFSLPKSLQKA